MLKIRLIACLVFKIAKADYKNKTARLILMEFLPDGTLKEIGEMAEWFSFKQLIYKGNESGLTLFVSNLNVAGIRVAHVSLANNSSTSADREV